MTLQPSLNFNPPVTQLPVGQFRKWNKVQEKAAIDVGVKISRQQRQIFEFVKSKGYHGATRAEIVNELGLSDGGACARINELMGKSEKKRLPQLLKESGRYRIGNFGKLNTVYVAVYGVEI